MAVVSATDVENMKILCRPYKKRRELSYALLDALFYCCGAQPWPSAEYGNVRVPQIVTRHKNILINAEYFLPCHWLVSTA